MSFYVLLIYVNHTSYTIFTEKNIDIHFQIPTWVSILMSLNHFLHGLSASLNLIIISITGSKFRETLIKLFGPKSSQEENAIKQKKIASKKASKHFEVKNVTFEDNHDIVQSNSQ